MSSAQLSALISLQQNDYVTLAVLTTVGYDYILTFSDEIEYIWNKPWSPVSTLFVVVRYLGISNLITCALLGSSFLPGFEKSYVFFLPLPLRLLNTAGVCHAALQGGVIYIINAWVFYLFLGAADCVMTLRVWAMYGLSRLILGILLAVLVLELISTLIRAAADSSPRNALAPVVRIVDDSFCMVITARVWSSEGVAFQMTHGATLCLLMVVRFVKQSIQMYHATKQWQSNRYINLLVAQGIFYFFALFLYDITTMLAGIGKFPTGGWQLIVLIVLNYVPVFTLTPRFILSIRKLYAHDRTRRGEGIDTGFGLSISDGSESALVFADVEHSGGLDSEVDSEVTAEEVTTEEVTAVQVA